MRSGFTVGRLSRASPRLAVFFGDIHGMAYALDASTGELIWKMQTDPHPLARITGTPVLYDGRALRAGRVARRAGIRPGRLRLLHVPRLSSPRSTRPPASRSGRPTRLPKSRRSSARTRAARTCSAPAGAGIWVTPILDVKRRALYFGTGNAFSGFAEDGQRDHGRQHGHRQGAVDDAGAAARRVAQRLSAGHSGRAIQPAGARARGTAGRRRRGGALGRGRGAAARPQPRSTGARARGAGPRGGGTPYPPENCPRRPGPTGTSPRRRRWPRPPTDATSSSRRRSRGSSGRSIRTPAPCSGSRTSRARSPAAAARRCLAAAVDHEKAYFGLVSSAHLALDLKTGEEVVVLADSASPAGRENKRGVVGAVTLIPGVLLSGARRRRRARGLVEDRSAALAVRHRAGVHDGQRRTGATADRSRRADRPSPTAWCSSDRAIRDFRAAIPATCCWRSAPACGWMSMPTS